ncbi:Membrane bound FAD containing D-sorbitol dehydrogenase [Pseudoxanthomonas sp. GM95]|uniref:sugar dehydrogenase complex small subunit n=1 Tax=Pseudoxanthomonas sp. GM95 TaxID=1881043 RepID=UPI0008B7AB07|nr:sugar dehydrogenase complex small subunit [Pseudoxanthomonas sp. GM95]SEL81237.1 Membrane bound FAD containing D-sorbitol dehydrogenase [Pseudoxanthomonas sp. GM95]
MVSRRNFLLAGGASLGAGATLLAIGGGSAASAATQPATAAALDALAPAPGAFIALADTLSGSIGVDRVLINRTFHTLSGVLPGLEATAAQLGDALTQVADIADPAARLAALETKGTALKDLFLRMNTALYLGTAEDKDGVRNCFGFETTASNQVMADVVQPPSYCTGSPNFWVDAPATVSQGAPTHV